MSKKFEKNLPFKVNELIKKNGIASAKIVDAELDIFECSFDNSESVIIKTKGYDYITLTLDNLKTLKKLISDSEKYYDKYFGSLEK
jgi:hypothetical protein